jgi:hypothetical protein
VPEILSPAPARTANQLSERVSDSYNHREAVAFAPFFQTINVIAAIFRAKVRRAIVGRILCRSKTLFSRFRPDVTLSWDPAEKWAK